MAEKCIKCNCDDPAMTRLIQEVGFQNENLNRMNQKLDRVCIGLYGTPDEPHKGMIVRVDRLEQKAGTFVKFLWAIVTSIIGLTVSKFWKGD